MNKNTKPIRLNPECVSCLIKKQIDNYPHGITADKRMDYMQSLLRIVSDAPKTMSAPEIMDSIYKLHRECFGPLKDYTEIKRHFNKLMLDILPKLSLELELSAEPLIDAVRYAMSGNFIDFAAMDKVDEGKLAGFLTDAKNIPIDEQEYTALKNDIANGKRLVYLTDNCGEIVLDKLLISVIRKINPELDITIIVRGHDVVNDATLEDAEQIGLTDELTVIGNGSTVAGTCLDLISTEAKAAIESADIIISKGQGNFETLHKCGLNVYYIFMCKCDMFARRFNVPLYRGILINDSSVRRLLS